MVGQLHTSKRIWAEQTVFDVAAGGGAHKIEWVQRKVDQEDLGAANMTKCSTC